jgi:hypothetical protein
MDPELEVSDPDPGPSPKLDGNMHKNYQKIDSFCNFLPILDTNFKYPVFFGNYVLKCYSLILWFWRKSRYLGSDPKPDQVL